MDETLGCCASIFTQIQYAFCNTRQYGTDATCCDNCCRFNCCWKQGPLPVEDYPVGNSVPEDRTQSVDARVEDDGGALPAYEATPQMVAAPQGGAVEGGKAGSGGAQTSS